MFGVCDELQAEIDLLKKDLDRTTEMMWKAEHRITGLLHKVKALEAEKTRLREVLGDLWSHLEKKLNQAADLHESLKKNADTSAQNICRDQLAVMHMLGNVAFYIGFSVLGVLKDTAVTAEEEAPQSSQDSVPPRPKC